LQAITALPFRYTTGKERLATRHTGRRHAGDATAGRDSGGAAV